MKHNRLLTLLAVSLTLLFATSAQTATKYKVLHAFGKGTDGAGLWSSVSLDKNGNLYGATSGGGNYGQGIVFKLTAHAGGNLTETILHNFPSFPDDGQGPNGGLVQDPEGHWYGTAKGGGAYHTAGAVFELTQRANGWAENIPYSFGTQSHDGGSPAAGLVMDDAGNLFGTTPSGDGFSGGTIFQLSSGSGGWEETVIYQFCLSNPTCIDGDAPYAGLILDASRNLYGTTEAGGIGCPGQGCGTVYEIEHAGSGWYEKVLHQFDNNGKDGVGPGWGALAIDVSGSLYGTTSGGGSNTCFARETEEFANGSTGRSPGEAIGNCGTIFKLIKLADGSWKEAILYNFKGGSTGSGPGAGVVMDRAGNLYGTTIYGGSGCQCGVVYRLSPSSGGKWRYTVLHTFVGSDGSQPDANLILDSAGNLYGTTATGGANGGGVVFELTP